VAIVWSLALVLVFAVARTGWFSQRAFERSPRRQTGLTAMDLPIGVLVMLLAVVAAGVIVRTLFPDVSVDAPPDQPIDPRTALAYLLGQILSFGPVAAFTLHRAARRGRASGADRRLGLAPSRLHADLVWALGGFVVIVCWLGALNLLTQLIARLIEAPMPQVAHELLERMVTTPSPAARWIMIASAVLIAPLLEEIIYRGLVQTTLLELFGRGRRWAVILAGSLLFTVVHLSAIGPASDAGALAMVSVLATLFLLALALGFIYERTGSLWPCVLIHVLFNATNIFIATTAYAAPPS